MITVPSPLAISFGSSACTTCRVPSTLAWYMVSQSFGRGVGDLLGADGAARHGHQDVAGAERGGQRVDLRSVRDVEQADLGAAARRCDPGRHLVEPVAPAGGQHHVVARGGEALRRRRSDTAACPGDHRCPLHGSHSASRAPRRWSLTVHRGLAGKVRGSPSLLSVRGRTSIRRPRRHLRLGRCDHQPHPRHRLGVAGSRPDRPETATLPRCAPGSSVPTARRTRSRPSTRSSAAR